MATAPRQVPKVYPAGTGRPTDRTLTDEKVVRTVNVAGTVWDAGKKRAGQDEVSISHAVGLFLEAYTAGLLDLDTITAQLDALAAGKDPAAVSSVGAWTQDAPSALAAPGWSSTDDVPNAFDILDAKDRP
ncbi:hypothetical protein OG444_40655 (plasmid) [Streptomyces sp. NBC_01232]|uniref:hypothetical protein n=1 Tax=Streptomyces sp. NBC_01232 TaxID=2903786 RepID=UPI002E0E3C25|nr:hypothetical protein OG444_40655 [Streptomyces sp. NBC_01232]